MFFAFDQAETTAMHPDLKRGQGGPIPMRQKRIFFAALTIAAAALASGQARADRVDDIKKAGVVRVATEDASPPWGFVDAQSKKIIGLDVDYAQELAKRLHVKLKIVPTNPVNRVPLLTSGKVDLVIDNFTITEERAKAVNFSIPYFAVGTQFIAKKGFLKSPDQLRNLRIGVDKGTTNEIQLRQHYPTATLIAYDESPFGLTALRNGQVQVFAQDGPALVGLLANMPDRDEYEIPPFSISQDYIGIGLPKDEKALTDYINDTLRQIEADGTAEKIYDAWLGPETKTPLKRTFKIGDKE
jgi:polar amino acid transport system substrate-binding protein